MKSPRMIAVITGTRADYGLLYTLIKAIHEDSALGLQLLVTGMHLSPEFGLTVREIETDGFPISKKVEILLSSDSSSGVVKSIGLGCISFADVLADLKPDILVILGDRFEALAAAIAALIQGIPIAHIHGGEISAGAFDDSIRHSITKMSSFHFVAAEAYRNRIIRMGEHPERVYVVGAPGLDGIRELKLLTPLELEEQLKWVIPHPVALVTFHPATLEPGQAQAHIEQLLQAVENSKIAALFTGANADTEGRKINERVKGFCQSNPSKYYFCPSLGRLRYFSLLKLVDLMIGNSSSGIIEAPSFGLPVVNIGDRQQGRITGENVIQAPVDAQRILEGIDNALTVEFHNQASHGSNPYAQDYQAGYHIKEILKNLEMTEGILKKGFFEG